ncbi:MAG TPA: deoxyribonuclease IV [Solirubrobacterales bacterium]
MLIGGHVSTAGGLDKAAGRGVETRSDAIQVFNQSPRAWRPTKYGPKDFARFREAVEGSRIRSVVIHAVYLINCATSDGELRKKSIASLTHALRVGEGIGAAGVVLHSGAAKGDPVDVALKRAGEAIGEALAETASCPLLLENTAGAKGLIGRDVGELAELVERIGGDERLGICLDSCHLFASGYDVRDADALSALLDEIDAELGLERLRCLHVNDSAVPLGANRDRHATLGDGEIGRDGLATFLSEPRFEELPAILETKFDRGQMDKARRIRKRGLERRGPAR